MPSFSRYESEDADVSRLAQPLKFEFSGKSAPNRFLKGAMSERLATWSPTDKTARGVPTPELINLYKRWGEGETGVILTGNTMIEYDELEAPGTIIIPPEAEFSGERFEAFKKLAEVSKAHGSLIISQVSHPGRQVVDTIQPNPISASDIQLTTPALGPGVTFAKPRPATAEDITRVITGFAHAAEYLHRAGFDGIQLHAAHGYLLAQFLSESTNKRSDAYGGSLENRARLIVEIADAIKARVPSSFSISIKLNSVEWQDKGFSTSEAADVAKLLETNGFDFVELSGGTYEEMAFAHKRDSTKAREAFFLEFADQIVAGLSKTKIYVTGGFRSAGAMVKALDTIDGVGLARPLCQEPRLPKDIISGKVTGVIKQAGIDQTDFGVTVMVSGVQIRQIGKDSEPFNAGEEDAVKGFMGDMKEWMGRMAKDEKGEMYGSFDLSVPAVPYGVVDA
ncbi:FMN-linked oxidoreductase [Aulographum hederae CBS 113979]|uniref:FMN-linked oxidoreductase n=1 Tax=Aulographum hederae CBS 113979 TaxID=1176131 RepID=A0A6G1GQV9_9PEZI|nr:FMN-linked oxidoreductase [Aulographum hederae CBS 113979]